MKTITLSPKCEIVIPREAHRKFALKPWQHLSVCQAKGHVELIPIQKTDLLVGFLNGKTNLLIEQEIQDRPLNS